jgi:hypothetical protein
LLSLATAEERSASGRLPSSVVKHASASLLLLVGSSETTAAAKQASSRLLGLGLIATEATKGGSSGLLLLTCTKW